MSTTGAQEPLLGAQEQQVKEFPTRGWSDSAKQQSKVTAFRYCFIDGLVKSEDEVSPYHDLGFTHGAGCYESVLFRNGQPFQLSDHCKRFIETSRSIGVPLPLDCSRLMQAVRSVVSRNNVSDCFVRLCSTPGNYGVENAPAVLTPTLVIECLPSRLPSVAEIVEGFNLLTAEDDRWARSDIKSCQLLPNIQALRAAQQQHCDDALFVDSNGNVSQATFANVFAFINGELHTPPAGPHTGVVPGMLRSLVLEIGESFGIPVNDHEPLSLWSLSHAEEAFLTSTSQLIRPIHTIDGKPVMSVCGPVTLQIMEELAGRIDAETGGSLPFSSISEDMKNLMSAGIGEHEEAV
ncbi:hypothetical protein P9112_013114 [Eukaryota sp. TZLM1-RC]